MHRVVERIDFDAFTFKDIKGDSLYILMEAYEFCNKQLKPGNLIMKKGFRMLTNHTIACCESLIVQVGVVVLDVLPFPFECPSFVFVFFFSSKLIENTRETC
jgi:hypothetical protein